MSFFEVNRVPQKIYYKAANTDCLRVSAGRAVMAVSQPKTKLADACFYGRNQGKSRHGADIAQCLASDPKRSEPYFTTTARMVFFAADQFAMARYYFHLSDGKQVLNNHKGIDLPGNAAAREDALVLAHATSNTGPSCRDGIGAAGSSRSSMRMVTRSTKCR